MPSPVLVKYFALVDEKGLPKKDRLASLIINQPETANALSGEILVSMTDHLAMLAKDGTVRAVILQSMGKHFSAGAHLKWMQESAKLDYEQNLEEAAKLTSMFESLYNMPMPTIAIAKGASYGGAVGMIAACDYALALDDARFCLSEAKIGLIPAVILPYLDRKMMRGQLRRLTLGSKVFDGKDALNFGLVEEVASRDRLEGLLKDELKNILTASPESQKSYKDLQEQVIHENGRQGSYTAHAISKIRASQSGQEGLSAFFEKRKPEWYCELMDSQHLLEL